MIVIIHITEYATIEVVIINFDFNSLSPKEVWEIANKLEKQN